MENYPIKSVTFGGFDKQDVIRYIEQTVAENEAARKELQDEIERLRIQIDELTAANAAAQEALNSALAEKEALEQSAAEDRVAAARNADALAAEIGKLRPDADNYARFRDRLGAIECEARERAVVLERSTAEQLNKTVEEFRAQYTNLKNVLETTTAYVAGELRKVEVNLSQLPRAMDRPGAELAELAKHLKDGE